MIIAGILPIEYPYGLTGNVPVNILWTQLAGNINKTSIQSLSKIQNLPTFRLNVFAIGNFKSKINLEISVVHINFFSCYESIWEHLELIFWIHCEYFRLHFLSPIRINLAKNGIHQEIVSPAFLKNMIGERTEWPNKLQ